LGAAGCACTAEEKPIAPAIAQAIPVAAMVRYPVILRMFDSTFEERFPVKDTRFPVAAAGNLARRER
jgi:hypothetical protein